MLKLAGERRGCGDAEPVGEQPEADRLAFHNYHDVNGALPPQAVHDKDGKALLSWRVLISRTSTRTRCTRVQAG